MTAITRRAQAWQRAGVLADRQHGAISREQLRRLGFKDGAISHAVATGRLHRVFRGAYALGHQRIAERGRLMAATLACGTGAVISHRSAGALLGLLDKGPVVIDVIAPLSRGRGIVGIYLHRVRTPRLEETGTFDDIHARARRGRSSTLQGPSANGRCAAPSSGRRGTKCSTSPPSSDPSIPGAGG
jgi:predicted transcriptional regulator of viral defense system